MTPAELRERLRTALATLADPTARVQWHSHNASAFAGNLLALLEDYFDARMSRNSAEYEAGYKDGHRDGCECLGSQVSCHSDLAVADTLARIAQYKADVAELGKRSVEYALQRDEAQRRAHTLEHYAWKLVFHIRGLEGI